MSHLGQQLSAWIDGELDGDERELVSWHLFQCRLCQDEAAALNALKRRMHELRMNALSEAAVGAGLTDRLIGLNRTGGDTWARAAGGWHFGGPGARPEAKAGRYFLAGSFALLLAGLGTAAFIAGGDGQVQAPATQIIPQVGAYTFEHDDINGLYLDKLLQGKALPVTGRDESLTRREP
jgi:anti-sigma factor RsiW